MNTDYSYIGILQVAREFLGAASVIVDCRRASKLRIAMTYLHGHAIELALKSILKKHGASNTDLRTKFGHDLEKCVIQASNLLPESNFIDNRLRDVVRLLNPAYKAKDLEYFSGSKLMTLPRGESGMNDVVGEFVNNLDQHYRSMLRRDRQGRNVDIGSRSH